MGFDSILYCIKKKNSDIKGERPRDHYERIDNEKIYTTFRESF